jgi:hypothetical protein
MARPGIQGVVYALLDKRSGEVKYVGKTQDPQGRFRDHQCTLPSNMTYCAHWIRKIGPENLGFKVLEEVLPNGPETLEEAEIRWIAYGRAQGWNLTNLTTGGEGAPGHGHPPWNKGKTGVYSKETQEKRSHSLQGRVFTIEHRVKLSNAKKGVSLSKEHRDAIFAKLTRKNGRWSSKEELRV